MKSWSHLWVLCMLMACSSENREKLDSERPNIILMVADDLGWADLSIYGSRFYETPYLDSLAYDGITFTNGYANCPVCSPSRASIQTGRYPIATGVTDWIKGRKFWTGTTENDRWIVPDTDYELKLEEKTLAEILKGEGYETAFFGKWHLGEDSTYWPEHQGYDLNVGGWSMGRPNLNRKKGLNGYFSPYGNPRLSDPDVEEYLPDRLTSEAIEFISTRKDQPFYLNLSFYLVHTPLQAKEEVIAKYKAKAKEMGLDTIQDLVENQEWMQYATGNPSRYAEKIVQNNPKYAAMVESLDENVGILTRYLKDQGLYDNTLIVFTSDNGGLSTVNARPTSNLPLRAGKGWMYEGGIRVPFIVKNIDQASAGTKTDDPVAGIDIFPTVTEQIGISKKSDVVDGVSLMPALKGQRLEERPLFWYYPHYGNQGGNPASAVRFGDHKLVHDLETGAYELYNLADDLGEKNNIVDSNPEVASQLRGLLEHWLQQYELRAFIENPDWNGSDPLVNEE